MWSRTILHLFTQVYFLKKGRQLTAKTANNKIPRKIPSSYTVVAIATHYFLYDSEFHLQSLSSIIIVHISFSVNNTCCEELISKVYS